MNPVRYERGKNKDFGEFTTDYSFYRKCLPSLMPKPIITNTLLPQTHFPLAVLFSERNLFKCLVLKVNRINDNVINGKKHN